MNVATWDIEASSLDANFGVLLSVGIKPYKKPPVMLCKGRIGENDKKLCIAAKKELEKYDLLISYYGLNYDLPFINSRLLFWNLDPLSVRFHIDMYRIVRNSAKLRLHRRRLETVSQFLGIMGKTVVEPQIWVEAALGRGEKAEKALAWIVKHNLQDVVVLEKTFDRLKRFIVRIQRV